MPFAGHSVTWEPVAADLPGWATLKERSGGRQGLGAEVEAGQDGAGQFTGLLGVDVALASLGLWQCFLNFLLGRLPAMDILSDLHIELMYTDTWRPGGWEWWLRMGASINLPPLDRDTIMSQTHEHCPHPIQEETLLCFSFYA